MLYVHITNECEQEARNHNQWHRVEKLARQLEYQQVSDNLDPYRTPFVKKDFGRSFRLVIGKVFDGEDELYVFWHFLPRGSKDYEKFSSHPEEFVPEFEQDFPPELRAQIWKEKRTLPPPTILQALSEQERAFLYQENSNDYSDFIVLESRDWISRTQDGFSSYISELHGLVEQACEKDSPNQDVSLVKNESVGVLYARFRELDILFLIAPVFPSQQRDIEQLRSRYAELANPPQADNPDERRKRLYRAARRAYPALIPRAGKELWVHAIEKEDSKANLALSEEEAEILRQRSGIYPLFINGRPGSGKSTVLQYLFVEYLRYYAGHRGEIQAPLYLTYSRELLDTARKNAQSLLVGNASGIIQKEISREQAEQLCSTSFWVFQDYLRTLLPESEQQKFSKEKYIAYPRFKRLYDEKFRYSTGKTASLRWMAETAWHVIRTYIKGTAEETDDFMSPDAYQEFPQKQKSVTQPIFELIHNEVWKKWYQPLCEENGYWDDQDLARAALQALSDEQAAEGFQGHAAVFCDEAQDFTRNELRLILRLSMFSRRRLTPDVLNRIPFAFAGDPFQTINPTGFDWSRIKANFYEVIRDQIDRREKPKLEVDFKDLRFNYRSERSTVQLCNFIHLLRGIAFGSEGLTPQETWSDAISAMPAYFDVESPHPRTYLKEQQTNVIIVPCHQDQEQEYAQNDELLRSLGNSATILSAMRAKGQEFSKVVLYKFGEACLQTPEYRKLLDLLSPQPPALTEDEKIPVEYFINRLYVAASRAQKRLLIVDTAQGIEEFWSLFYKVDLQTFIERYRKIDERAKNSWNASHLVHIQPGQAEDWEKDENDPLKLAEQWMEQGRRTENSYLLERAAWQYRLAGNESKAIECEALAFEIKGEFEQAGDRYKARNETKKAEECYWKARAYEKLASLKSGTVYENAARFMFKQADTVSRIQKGDPNIVKGLHGLHDKFKENLESGAVRPDETWSEVLTTIYDTFLKADESTRKPYEWETLYRAARDYQKKGILPEDKSVERLVNQLWARSTIYPARLEILQTIGAQPGEILSLYSANVKQPLSPQQAGIVFNAFRRLDKWDDAQAFAAEHPSIDFYATLLADYLNAKSQREYRLETLLPEFFRFLTEQNQWDIAFDFVTEHRLPVQEHIIATLQNHVWGEQLDAAFIKALSISESLAGADRNTLIRVSGYLSNRLLERASAFHSLVTVAQAGGALERANKITDCLEFYENVWKKRTWPATQEEIGFARQRWLVCKARQRDQLASSEEEKRRIQREIIMRQKEWGIDSFAHLPAYPQVDWLAKPARHKPEAHDVVIEEQPDESPVLDGETIPDEPPVPDGETIPEDTRIVSDASPVETLPNTPDLPTASVSMPEPEVIEIQIHALARTFHIKLFRPKGKLTIQQQGEAEMVTINAKTGKINGSDEDLDSQIQAVEQSPSRSVHYVQPWDLTCVLQMEDDARAELYLGRQAVALCSIRLGPSAEQKVAR